MARRLSTYDYFIPSAEWQYKKAIEIGLVHDEILKRLSEDTGKSEAELTKLMNEAGVKAIKADDKIYKKAGLSPAPLKSSYALRGILQTGLIQTKNTFANLTRTIAVAGSRQFEIALDNAYMQIISGAFDSNTAIRNSIEVLAKQGLCSITYANGKVDTIETAVKRAVLTGVNITCGKMQEARADEMGCDLVETTAHEGARESHAIWQGKVFSRSGTHPKYPHFKTATGLGTGAGLCGWNCRHSFFPFFENSSESAYTDEELEGYSEPKYEYNGEMLTHYEASQKQRQIERNIRRWKREELAMEVAGLDSSKAHEKVRAWQAKQRDFVRQTGLKRQYNREQIGKVVDGNAKKGYNNVKNNAKVIELISSDVNESKIKFTKQNLVKKLQESSIGLQTIKNIEEADIVVNLVNEIQMHTNRGEQIGKNINIFLSNIHNEKVATQTIIHEVTHAYYNIGRCQHAEAICFAMEKMHILNRDYLTPEEWEQMVKLAVDNYPELKWEDGGYGNFK